MITLTRARPLLGVNAVMGILDRNEDQVIALVERGALLAVNLANVETRRRCLRIFTESIEAFNRGAQPPAFQNLLEKMLPGHCASFRVSGVCSRLNISHDHTCRLIKAGLLSLPSSSAPTGVPRLFRRSGGFTGIVEVSRDSLIRFLNQRLCRG